MFVYHGSGHSNRISDFDPTVDKVQFQAGSAEELVNVFEAQGATVSISDFGGGALVQFDGNSIKLAGVSASYLTSSDFLFPPGTNIGMPDHKS